MAAQNVFTKVNSWKAFGGQITKVKHFSAVIQGEMTLSVFLPSQATQGAVPVVYWLSGLTCTDDNFMHKAGAFRAAERLGLALVAPDTSPRVDLPGDKEAYDFGQGAGFYVNATQEPWSKHYRMYDYVNRELPGLVAAEFPVLAAKQALMGHSMGGHGALISGLREGTGLWKSVSAFAPIANPVNCAWGQKAFKGYLGEDEASWKAWDSTELVKALSPEARAQVPDFLVDVGTADNFLQQKQLLPEAFEEAAKEAGLKLQLNYREGYDHSYYFISTFIDEHLEFHAKHLL